MSIYGDINNLNQPSFVCLVANSVALPRRSAYASLDRTRALRTSALIRSQGGSYTVTLEILLRGDALSHQSVFGSLKYGHICYAYRGHRAWITRGRYPPPAHTCTPHSLPKVVDFFRSKRSKDKGG